MSSSSPSECKIYLKKINLKINGCSNAIINVDARFDLKVSLVNQWRSQSGEPVGPLEWRGTEGH